MDLSETGWGSVDWIQRVLVNTSSVFGRLVSGVNHVSGQMDGLTLSRDVRELQFQGIQPYTRYINVSLLLQIVSQVWVHRQYRSLDTAAVRCAQHAHRSCVRKPTTDSGVKPL
jgi:hypothetical protein